MSTETRFRTRAQFCSCIQGGKEGHPWGAGACPNEPDVPGQPDVPAQPDSLDAAWAEAEAALPEGWYISNVRSKSPGGRWSASATLHGHDTGANYSGFGETPPAALRALAARFRGDDAQ